MAVDVDPKTLLTRYLIFEVSEDTITLTRIGEHMGRSSEAALRGFFADPKVDRDDRYVAISENNAKLRRARATVKTTITEEEWAPLPESAAEAAVAPDPVETTLPV